MIAKENKQNHNTADEAKKKEDKNCNIKDAITEQNVFVWVRCGNFECR